MATNLVRRQQGNPQPWLSQLRLSVHALLKAASAPAALAHCRQPRHGCQGLRRLPCGSAPSEGARGAEPEPELWIFYIGPIRNRPRERTAHEESTIDLTGAEPLNLSPEPYNRTHPAGAHRLRGVDHQLHGRGALQAGGRRRAAVRHPHRLQGRRQPHRLLLPAQGGVRIQGCVTCPVPPYLERAAARHPPSATMASQSHQLLLCAQGTHVDRGACLEARHTPGC